MASYYPPSIATAINSQESTWGVQYTYIPTADITIYAHWTQIPTISFNATGILTGVSGQAGGVS